MSRTEEKNTNNVESSEEAYRILEDDMKLSVSDQEFTNEADRRKRKRV